MSNHLKFDEFLRSVAISKDSSYTMLLGAGCSINFDIQSANDCIWEWKKIIYKIITLMYKTGLKIIKILKYKISSKNGWTIKEHIIQKEIQKNILFLPKNEENRRQYFQKICSNKEPSAGYRTIPILLGQGMLDSVWTTNFDDLVNIACINGKAQGIDISLDTVDRKNQSIQNKNELPIIKLHGDYKYGALKNTSQELQHQDETLRSKLVDYLTDKHLIVLGYSVRDSSK